MTFLDVSGSFVEVLGIANASVFATEQQSMADLAGKVKVLASSAATSAAPAAAQPAPTTPASKQPPPARSPR